jgi:hypothetical protein
MQATFSEIRFTDEDVVNPDDFIAKGESNPHKVRPWLLHDHGFVLAVVFASCLQDALDEAVDNDKLNRYQIDPADAGERGDYMTANLSEMATGFDENCPEYVDANGTKYWWKVEPTFLGNAGEPFDIESLSANELPNPAFSFVALFNASR